MKQLLGESRQLSRRQRCFLYLFFVSSVFAVSFLLHNADHVILHHNHHNLEEFLAPMVFKLPRNSSLNDTTSLTIPTIKDDSDSVKSTSSATNTLGSTTSKTTNTTSHPTIVVELSGELGNHLGLLVHAFGVKWYAKEAFGLDFDIISLHQSDPKWVRGKDDMQKCFPHFRDWDFDLGSGWAVFGNTRKQQNGWLPEETREILQNVNGPRMEVRRNRNRHPVRQEDLDEVLNVFVREYNRTDKPNRRGFDQVSLPYLAVNRMDDLWFIDRYYDRIREWFHFDQSGDCCGVSPDEDETVFHFRNFWAELKRITITGLEDLSPERTAKEMLGHLKPGEKVAIITRSNDAGTHKQVQALEERGLQVRVIENQTGVQDFCFLLRTQKEVIGNFVSTYVFWGAFLGNTRSIRLFAHDNPRTRQRYETDENLRRRYLYNFTHPSLKDRVHLSILPQEAPVEEAASNTTSNATVS